MAREAERAPTPSDNDPSLRPSRPLLLGRHDAICRTLLLNLASQGRKRRLTPRDESCTTNRSSRSERLTPFAVRFRPFGRDQEKRPCRPTVRSFGAR